MLVDAMEKLVLIVPYRTRMIVTMMISMTASDMLNVSMMMMLSSAIGTIQIGTLNASRR